MSNPIYVTSLEDDATKAGTLRYAVAQVNAGLYDSIIISSSLSGQTIELLSSLTVSSSVSIDGENTVISCNNLTEEQCINVTNANAVLTLNSKMDIKGGRSGDIEVIRTYHANLGENAEITVNHSDGAALALYSTSSIDVDKLAGEIVTYSAVGDATGVFAYSSSVTTNVKVGDFTGNISATSLKSRATGFYACSFYWAHSPAYVTVDNFSGEVVATATNSDSSGIYTYTDWSGDSSITVGTFTGEIISNSINGRAYGMKTQADWSGSDYTSSIAIGDFSGTITVSAADTVSGDEESYAIGILAHTERYANTKISIGNLSGTISATATGGSATGLNAVTSDASVTMKSMSGNITAASNDRTAAGIVTKTLRTSDDSTLQISGTIIADGKTTETSAISTEKLNIAVSGILAAGDFKTTESETGMSDLLAKLKAKDETVIQSTAAAVKYYAVASTSGDDAVELKNGSLVFGDISLGAGTNNVTISTGARMYGNLTADTMNLKFNVDALTSNTALTVTEDGIFGTNNGTYSLVVDTGTGMADGNYSLVSGLSANAMTGKVFTVYDTNGTKLSDLTVNGGKQTVGDHDLKLVAEDSKLCLTVSGEKEAASLVVTTAEDVVDAYDGVISLREALAYAASDSSLKKDGKYTITFDDSIFTDDSVTITLNSTLEVGESIFTEEYGELVIQGTEGKSVILDGSGKYQILDVSQNIISLKNLTFQNGYSQNGGAIVCAAKTTIDNCSFIGNDTQECGGAIYINTLNDGDTISVNNCTFSSNHTGNSGGAICHDARGKSTIAVSHCVFSDNSAGYNAAIYNSDSGTFIVTDCIFEGNKANRYGGAINRVSLVKNCTFANNSASEGGAINTICATTVINSTFLNNSASTYGGAIIQNSSPLYLFNNTFGSTSDSVKWINSLSSSSCDFRLANNIFAGRVSGKITVDAGNLYSSASLVADTFAEVVDDKAVLNEDGTVHIKVGGAADGTGVYVWHNEDYSSIAYSETYSGEKIAVIGDIAEATILSTDQLGNQRSPDSTDIGAVVAEKSAPVIVSTITGNFNGKGSAFQLMSDGTAYVRSNTAKKMLDETIDVSKWQVVDSGDFGATGEDGLLWLEKSTGYVYMQYDMTSLAEVNNKTNCLGVLGEGYSIQAAGDFTGNGISGALLQGPEFGVKSFSLNYGLPVWARNDDGSTFPGWLGALVNTWQEGDPLKGDLTDPASINANNYQYKLVGVGDFNGDGRDDVMIQNTMPEVVTEKGVDYTITGSGDVFTFLTGSKDAVKRGDAPTVCYAGCATDGWEVLGFGDFNADGIDDTLLSDGTGLAGWQMANGQRQDNFWFGNLDTNNEFAGIADFNNDGTDDILIRNTATETLTAWTVKDGAVTGAIALK